MMNQMNAQMGSMALPYSPHQQQHQFGNYQFVPNIQLDAYTSPVAYALQPLALGLINDIQANANSSPMSMFLFNQMAGNGFMNENFVSMVADALALYAYYNSRGQIMTPQDGVMTVIAKTVLFAGAKNISNFPALKQYVREFGLVQAAINEMSMIASQMANDRSMAMRNYPGTMQQFNAGPGMMPMNSGMNNFQGAVGNNNMNRNVGSVFTKDPTQSMPTGSNSGLGRDFSTAATPVQQFEPTVTATPVQDAVVNRLEEQDNRVELSIANKNWIPSEGCYHRPAYEPSHQKLVAVEKNNRYYYQVKPLGENEMDPAKHRLTPLFGGNNTIVTEQLHGQTEETAKALANAVSDAKAAKPHVDITIDTYSRIRIDQKMPIELGYDSVWVSGIVEQIKRSRSRGTTEPINIIQWDSKVARAVQIDDPEQTEIIRRLSKLNSNELIATVKNLRESLSPEVIKIIDQRLTQATNEALKINMTIPGLTIGSFIDDWTDLINYVSNKYGNMTAANIMSHDDEIIKRALTILDDECAQDVTKGIYDTEDDGVYPISYFVENVSFTALQIFSSELDLDFVKDTGALLSKVNTRVWYDLAEQIFKEYGDNCTRHLIRTCDGEVLEVRKGWVDNSSYLISVVS